MFASRARLLLPLAVCLFAAIGTAVVHAAAGSGSSSCAPAAFTGSVRTHSNGCVTKAITSPGLLGPRGRRGRDGLAGPRGFDGPTGQAGSAGQVGLSGLSGPQGPAGAAGDVGAPGAPGTTGSAGSPGAQGIQGNPGVAGLTGGTGLTGTAGPIGLTGSTGLRGSTGPTGSPGALGAAGSTGATGATGPSATPDFAEFYALMPPDNAATVAPGTSVAFPRNGPTSGTIVRVAPSTFLLPNIGTYSVMFSVPVTEAGQLVLNLNGAELPNTVYGRATGSSPIAGATLITTTGSNSVLSVNNPSSAAAALTITPLAGGPDPDTASLVIQELN